MVSKSLKKQIRKLKTILAEIKFHASPYDHTDHSSTMDSEWIKERIADGLSEKEYKKITKKRHRKIKKKSKKRYALFIL